MAIINRKSGMVRGRIGDEVYSRHRGRQTVRKMPAEITVKNTPRWIALKTIVGEISAMWRELPEYIKTLWEKYAKELGSPSEVEKNENVSYRFCPIPNYPPRPRNIRGVQAFISANCRGYYAGFELPLLYPSLDVAVPSPPDIACRYDHSSGELVVRITAPAMTDRMKVRKAFIWITAFMNVRGRRVSVVQKQLLDSFDISMTTNPVIEKRYAGIKDTGKHYSYRPLAFKCPAYLRIYIGAQVLAAPDFETAPVVTCGSYIPYWILNKPRYIELEDMLLAGELKNIAKIKFRAHFTKYLQAKRRKLAKTSFVVL